MTKSVIYCLSGAENSKLVISHDELRSLFNQIEAEFCQSDVYQKAFEGLRKRLGNAPKWVHLLIKAIGREAIRLTLRQIITQFQTDDTVHQLDTHAHQAETSSTPSHPSASHPAAPHQTAQIQTAQHQSNQHQSPLHQLPLHQSALHLQCQPTHQQTAQEQLNQKQTAPFQAEQIQLEQNQIEQVQAAPYQIGQIQAKQIQPEQVQTHQKESKTIPDDLRQGQPQIHLDKAPSDEPHGSLHRHGSISAPTLPQDGEKQHSKSPALTSLSQPSAFQPSVSQASVSQSPASQPSASQSPVSPIPSTPNRFMKRKSKASATQEALEQAYQDIGMALRQARIEQSLTVRYVHEETKVGIHQIEAIESGNLERLPEEIYIQGFIRQIARVVGVDYDSLMALLPQQTTKPADIPLRYSRVPSGSSRSASSRKNLFRPAHLYIGYAALMASATGGLIWVNHSQGGAQLEDFEMPIDLPPIDLLQMFDDLKSTLNVGSEKQNRSHPHEQYVTPEAIATPEVITVESSKPDQ